MTSQTRLRGYCASGCQPSAPQLANADCLQELNVPLVWLISSLAKKCWGTVRFLNNEKNNGNYKTNGQRSSISLTWQETKPSCCIEFRRYPAWHFFKGCLRGSSWLHQTSAAKRTSCHEMGTSSSTPKRFLSFWLWNCGLGTAEMGWWGLHRPPCLGTWDRLVQLQSGWRHYASHCDHAGWRGFLNSTPLAQCIESLKCVWSM